MVATIGMLEPVELRELWRHEEHGFSKWLFENGQILERALGLQLVMLEREKWVGSFKVDLVAETVSGQRVIIENQLEPSNHDHLGKLLTYATNLEAKLAIWIVGAARAEHVRAINWLNEYTPADTAFFLLTLEAFRIGESPPAPSLTVLAGPTADAKAFGDEKKELAERHHLRLRFWERLLDLARQRGLLLHNGRSPTKENWISAGAGRSGLSWIYVIRMENASAQFYIGTDDADTNKSIFDQLEAHRAEIEAAFGGRLEWERLDEKQGSRIQHTITAGGLTLPQDRWPTIQEVMLDAMTRLHQALQPHIGSLTT